MCIYSGCSYCHDSDADALQTQHSVTHPTPLQRRRTFISPAPPPRTRVPSNSGSLSFVLPAHEPAKRTSTDPHHHPNPTLPLFCSKPCFIHGTTDLHDIIRLIEDVRVYGSFSTSLSLLHFTSSPPPSVPALVLALRTSNATPPAYTHFLPPHVQNVRTYNIS
ncbi:hypothetical protein H2248_012255 [Termitomyces sp. 'cryptogamus']|nr:hypothetical protein H2248_012255 [Termitomyces sp. 'cryptogamus']